MGCGASKSPDPAALLPQSSQRKDVRAPQNTAAAPANATDKAPSRTGSGTKDDVSMADAAALAKDVGDGDGPQGPDTTATRSRAEEDGPKKTHTGMDVAVVTAPECTERDAVPERPATAEAEDPTRAAFRARFQGLAPPDDGPTASITFKSSRSLNRSIGVRRRESDAGSQGSQQGAEPARAAHKDKDEKEKVPDSLVEQFEMTKDANPLLLGRKVTSNGILSGRPSEKSIKSHKRLVVGFVVEGTDGEKPGSGGATVEVKGDCASETDDLDPEDHMESERIASIVAPRAEVAVPVVQPATS